MTLLKKNIAANFAGNIWQALMGLAFVPLYIEFMGVESYGLIGIFAALQGLFALLDMGLGATLTREMARLSVLPDKEQETRDLVRSLEVIYWCVAALIGAVIMAIAPSIAHHWIKASQLSPRTVEQALRIMGVATALQWPAAFYSGGLIGLQKQVLLNSVNGGISTLRGAGAVLVLWMLSPTIQAYFSWQIVISIVNTCLLSFFLWRSLPPAGRGPAFRKPLLAGVWRFAAGMSGISVLGTILTQLDKIILSKMLSLEMFGYYALAGIVGMSLYRLIGPVSAAVYPRLTQLASLSDRDGLKRLYHKSCQFMSVLTMPVTAVIAVFSYEVLLLWMQNPVTAGKCHLLVSVLIFGTALNGQMTIPHALQLAHGWTKLVLFSTMIAVMILAPVIIVLTRQYGALGGAGAWVILNGGLILTTIHIMHRRLLPGEKWRWYWQDMGLPLVVSAAAAGAGRAFMPGALSQPGILLYLGIVSFATLAATAAASPVTRGWLLENGRAFGAARRG